MSVAWSTARRTGIDPGCGCGSRQFQSELLAEKARDRGASLPGAAEVLRVRACPRRPGVWHLAAVRHDETFPPLVAAQITARDPWCVLDGSPRGLHLHHRRVRGIGGDPRPHADCACNGVRLCSACHARIHDTAEGRVLAEAEGLIIPRVTAYPGSLSVLVHLEDDAGGPEMWPTCDGRWLDCRPELAA